jgi:hypothetical protein
MYLCMETDILANYSLLSLLINTPSLDGQIEWYVTRAGFASI